MNCPVCGENTKVAGSKSDCDAIYRKRRCLSCNYVFYTEEFESVNNGIEYHRLLREYEKSLKRHHRGKKVI